MKPAPRDRALALLRRYGWNATSFQVLEPEFHYWFADDDSFVAYVERGRARIVAGGPVCAEERLAPVVREFIADSEVEGYRVCFFAVERRLLERCALRSIKLGAQPWWDPMLWSDALKTRGSLREQLRRARAGGVVVQRIPALDVQPRGRHRSAMESLIRRWIAAKPMPPMAFLVDVEPFAFPEERLYWGAWLGNHMVAFAVAVPVYARNGWFIEDLIRDPQAPNGTVELLFDHVMNDLAERGIDYVTMGLAPLAGVTGVLAGVRSLTGGLYNFDGVLAFKRKLMPQGEVPLFVAWQGSRSEWTVLYDTLNAFVRGGWMRFAGGTFLRGPAPVLTLLGWLLLFWTAALAHPSAQRFFPSRRVRTLWVIFDLALVPALILLGDRWSRPLGKLAIAAVTADCILTTSQVIHHNARRRWSAGEWLLIAAGATAPFLALLVLTGAAGRRRRPPMPRPLNDVR